MSSSYSYAYRQSSPPSPMDALFSLTPLDAVVQKHLRKVYSSLSRSLIVAALGVYAQTAVGINIGAFLCGVITIGLAMYFLSMAEHDARRPYAFYAFAFAEGWSSGPLISLVASIDHNIPLFAFIGTATIFFCFSVAAMLAKRRSYLFLGGLLSSALTGLFWIGLFNTFSRSVSMMSVQLYGGLLAFCGFVLYDSQLIIEKAHAGERDYLKHAFELLMDFVAVFRHIIVIMAKNSQQRQRKEEEKRRRSN